MSDPNTPAGGESPRQSRRSRYAENVNRQEEDLQDWFKGSGQITLGLLGIAFLAVFAWKVVVGG